MSSPQILVLGIGNKLLTDEGFGVHVVDHLLARYTFADNVSVVDGGVMGMGLLGIMSEADDLVVVDIIRNNGAPGTLYRIVQEDIPKRVRAKNSMHQMDFLETMTVLETGLDRVPRTVILGAEPEDYHSCSLEMTSLLAGRVEEMAALVLRELDRLGAAYYPKTERTDVSCRTFPDCRN